MKTLSTLIVTMLLLMFSSQGLAGPCMFVMPRVTVEKQPAVLERTDNRKTYIFYKNGIESIVIRPSFKGNVEEFGVLIPLPSVPSVRKVPEEIFSHLCAAIDPPEVSVNLDGSLGKGRSPGGLSAADSTNSPKNEGMQLGYNEVRVVKEEALGMYELAVLEAGSSLALKKWMEERKFVFPDGAESVCDEYVTEGYCFVAVKARVAAKAGVSPKPGMKDVDDSLPKGAVFDGNTSALGFRFRSEKLMLPTRLATYNDGSTQNTFYVLTDEPIKGKDIPEKRVVRQVTGADLYINITQPLPLRLLGGDGTGNIPQYLKSQITNARNPKIHNGQARDLFVGDLLAAERNKLDMAFEEAAKALDKISERLGLDPESMGPLHDSVVEDMRKSHPVDAALASVLGMTLTIIDGELPRDVLRNDDVYFSNYSMPISYNTPKVYDARLGEAPKTHKTGVLVNDTKAHLLALDLADQIRLVHQKSKATTLPATSTASETKNPTENTSLQTTTPKKVVATIEPSEEPVLSIQNIAIVGALLFVIGLFFGFVSRSPKGTVSALLFAAIALSLGTTTSTVSATAPMPPTKGPTTDDAKDIKMPSLISDLSELDKSEAALANLVKRSEASVPYLIHELLCGDNIISQGWCIVAMQEIARSEEGTKVFDRLEVVQSDTTKPLILRCWSAAARANLTSEFDSILKQIRRTDRFAFVQKMLLAKAKTHLTSDDFKGSTDELLLMGVNYPQLAQQTKKLAENAPVEELVKIWRTGYATSAYDAARQVLSTLSKKKNKEIIEAITASFAFDAKAKQSPFNNYLYLPTLTWDQESARKFTEQLIRWHIWIDEKFGKNSTPKYYIYYLFHNSGVFKSVGYKSKSKRAIHNDYYNSALWLKNWGETVGYKGVGEILEDLGLEEKEKYKKVYDKLREDQAGEDF